MAPHPDLLTMVAEMAGGGLCPRRRRTSQGKGKRGTNSKSALGWEKKRKTDSQMGVDSNKKKKKKKKKKNKPPP